MRERSGDLLSGMAFDRLFEVYGLGVLFSRARSAMAWAAAAIAGAVFAGRARFGDAGFGFNGSGGGARSGSELSHLRKRRLVKGIAR